MKSREHDLREGGLYPYWGSNWPYSSPEILDLSVRGTDTLLESQGHEYRQLGKSDHDIGGSFRCIKHSMWDQPIANAVHSTSVDASAPNQGHYHGPMFAAGKLTANSGWWPIPYFASNSQMDALGTTAIARVMPTNPVSNMVQSLVELKREGIPSIAGVQAWKGRSNLARSAGSEYLNQQFGWLPLVNDLKDFSHVVANSDELIAQYDRNSGKRIKRSFTWPMEVTELSRQLDQDVYLAPALPGNYFAQPPGSPNRQVWTYEVSTLRWFKGCFMYYIPPYNSNGDNSKRNRQLAYYLFGARLTPELLWNLTPWSWAADWIGNFGDYLHNVSAFQNDGLVMQYGYMMETTIHSTTKTIANVYPKTIGGQHSCTSIWSTTTKSRRAATPYGFGLNVDSFSNRQWAIIGALGISRSPQRL